MFTIIADSHTYRLQAERLADALREDGADVYLDEGYANTVLSRIYSASTKWVIHVRDRTTVAVRNKYDGTVSSNMKSSAFLSNWQSYCD